MLKRILSLMGTLLVLSLMVGAFQVSTAKPAAACGWYLEDQHSNSVPVYSTYTNQTTNQIIYINDYRDSCSGYRQYFIGEYPQDNTPLSGAVVRYRVWVCGTLEEEGTVWANNTWTGSYYYGGCGPQVDTWGGDYSYMYSNYMASPGLYTSFP